MCCFNLFLNKTLDKFRFWTGQTIWWGYFGLWGICAVLIFLYIVFVSDSDLIVANKSYLSPKVKNNFCVAAMRQLIRYFMHATLPDSANIKTVTWQQQYCVIAYTCVQEEQSQKRWAKAVLSTLLPHGSLPFLSRHASYLSCLEWENAHLGYTEGQNWLVKFVGVV